MPRARATETETVASDVRVPLEERIRDAGARADEAPPARVDSDDRRGERRRAIALEAFLELGEGEVVSTMTLDVSATGLCVRGYGVVALPGERVRVTLPSASIGIGWMRGEVRWRTPSRIGIELVISPGDLRAWQRVVAR